MNLAVFLIQLITHNYLKVIVGCWPESVAFCEGVG